MSEDVNDLEKSDTESIAKTRHLINSIKLQSDIPSAMLSVDGGDHHIIHDLPVIVDKNNIRGLNALSQFDGS